MENEGIMALPMGGMQAPTAQPTGADAAIAAFEQMRQQTNPKEFGDELLGAAEQADPAAVQEFKQALQGLQLPPEIIDALGDMVDVILAEPQNYQEIRAELIKDGVPEDLLPPEFDAAYFGAMNLALDQLSANISEPAPQAFADGGIAMLPIPAGLASMGRGQDSMIAHISPAEARLLRRRGGAGTINPYTGQPEFLKKFFKSVGKAIGGAFKSVGKAISSVVKSVGSAIKKFASSTVGKVVTTIALGFFLGPAAATMLGVSSAAGVAAVSGFIGSAGSTLLSGGSVKDALKSGVVGGLTAGVGAGVMGGANAFQSGSYTGPTTISGRVDQFTEGLKSLSGAPGATPEVSGTLGSSGTGDIAPGTNITNPQLTAPQVGAPEATLPQALQYEPQFGTPVQYAGTSVPSSEFAAPQPAASYLPPDTQYDLLQQEVAAKVPYSAPTAPVYSTAPEGIMGTLKSGYDEYLRPYSPGGIEESGKLAAEKAYSETLARTGSEKLAEKAYTSAMPGTFSKYAPMVAAGTALAYGAGMFDPTVPEAPGIIPKETGFDLYNQNPALYGVTPGGARMTYDGNSSGYGQMGTLFSPPQFSVRDPRDYLPANSYSPMGIASVAPRRFNTGGFANGGIRTLAQKYPRRNGQISGPGTEKSDSIPAMLSDGEFVMTAKAVRGAGGGSRREGAKRMYQMMHKFERKA